MIVKTNVIDALKSAERSKDSKKSFPVVDLSNSKNVKGVWVRYESDFDYFVFEHSDETEMKDFQQKYGAIFYAIFPSPQNKKILAIHLKIPSKHRIALSSFFEDLILQFDPGNTDHSIWEVIGNWVERFTSFNSKILSEQEVIGLFGELVVLWELLHHNPNACEWWVGPSGKLHDFISNDWELEVKSSTLSDPTAQVHPIDQLQPTGAPFSLVIVKLIKETQQGEKLKLCADCFHGVDHTCTFMAMNLSQLIMKIRKSLNNKNRNIFDASLSLSKYKDEDKDRYLNRFAVGWIKHYRIDDKTLTLCPLTILPSVQYADIRWTLRASDYVLIDCDSDFWNNPAI